MGAGVQDDALVGAVLGGEVGPDGRVLLVGRAALSDDAAVPARVVVQVDDDVHVRARVERGLDGLVVGREEGLVDGSAEVGGHQLPG